MESESRTRRQSLAHNDILNNSVTNGVSSGISSVSNLNARIESNHVDGTGPNSPGTGIGVSANTAAIIPETGDVVSGNVVTNIGRATALLGRRHPTVRPGSRGAAKWPRRAKADRPPAVLRPIGREKGGVTLWPRDRETGGPDRA